MFLFPIPGWEQVYRVNLSDHLQDTWADEGPQQSQYQWQSQEALPAVLPMGVSQHC